MIHLGDSIDLMGQEHHEHVSLCPSNCPSLNDTSKCLEFFMVRTYYYKIYFCCKEMGVEISDRQQFESVNFAEKELNSLAFLDLQCHELLSFFP